MAAIERTKADTSTAWAATTTGRVFVSKNVDAEPASAVTWTRIDDDATTPNRFVSEHLRGRDEREPRLDLVQRLRLQDADDARVTCSRSPTTPRHGTSTWIDRSLRPRRPADHGRRGRRRERRPLRVDRLRCPSRSCRGRSTWTPAGAGNAERRGRRPDHRPGATGASTPRPTGSAPGSLKLQ